MSSASCEMFSTPHANFSTHNVVQRIDATVKNTISAIEEGGTVAARQRIAKAILS